MAAQPQFIVIQVPAGVPLNPYANGGAAPAGADPGAWASFLQMDTDRSNSIEAGELLQGLRSAFVYPGGYSPWDFATARLLVRVFDSASNGSPLSAPPPPHSHAFSPHPLTLVPPTHSSVATAKGQP